MTHTDPPPQELELKFQLSPEALARLEAHPALQSATLSPVRREVTTYYDTPSWDLARHGATVRVRSNGRQRVQTLKLRDVALGPFARNEWEWAVRADRPELERLAATPAGKLLRDAEGLQPVFVTEVERQLRVVEHQGATIELALDRGRVVAGEASEPICELELELKQGEPEPLYRLAVALHDSVPMVIGAEAKSDRGRRLRTGQPRSAVRSEPAILPPDVSAGEAFRRAIGGGLACLLGNQPAAAVGDMEAVHQMRVAIRRLRAALVLFRPLLEPHATARFTAALRRLGHVFGEARDWDVFCRETLVEAGQNGVAREWLALLQGPAEAARAVAHAHVAEELRQPALTAVVLGLAAWAGDPAALAGSPDGGLWRTPLAKLAPELAARLQRKARRRGRHLDDRSDAELHALRKSMKKLRYGVELLAPLWRRKQVEAYLHGCKALQKHLGRMNDSVVAVALAEQLGGARQEELAPAVAELAGWATRRKARSREHLQADWRTFRALSLPGG